MARGRGGGRGARENVSREVQVSKKMSWLLRHGAEKEGLKLDDSGFINVDDMLKSQTFKSLRVTLDEVRQVVENNDKKRFTMVPVAGVSLDGGSAEQTTSTNSPLPSVNPKDYLIRANQGHSLKVDSEGLLQPILAENQPAMAVHGTTHAAWTRIVESGGLKPMSRNHVHFASGLPQGFSRLSNEESSTVSAPVISGMRNSSTVLIYLDIPKALDSGLQLWLSDNGVILSPGNERHLVPLDLFKLVEDRTGEGILVENGKIIKPAPASWVPRRDGKS